MIFRASSILLGQSYDCLHTCEANCPFMNNTVSFTKCLKSIFTVLTLYVGKFMDHSEYGLSQLQKVVSTKPWKYTLICELDAYFMLYDQAIWLYVFGKQKMNGNSSYIHVLPISFVVFWKSVLSRGYDILFTLNAVPYKKNLNLIQNTMSYISIYICTNSVIWENEMAFDCFMYISVKDNMTYETYYIACYVTIDNMINTIHSN